MTEFRASELEAVDEKIRDAGQGLASVLHTLPREQDALALRLHDILADVMTAHIRLKKVMHP